MLLPRCEDVDVRTVQGVEKGILVEQAFDATPLHLACSFGQHEMAKALLKRGASRMARDSESYTPLHYAALAGHLRCVIAMLGRADHVKMTPAEVNAVNSAGTAPSTRGPKRET